MLTYHITEHASRMFKGEICMDDLLDYIMKNHDFPEEMVSFAKKRWEKLMTTEMSEKDRALLPEFFNKVALLFLNAYKNEDDNVPLDDIMSVIEDLDPDDTEILLFIFSYFYDTFDYNGLDYQSEYISKGGQMSQGDIVLHLLKRLMGK